MKRWIKRLLIICGSIIALWIAARVTNTFQWYHAVSFSNEPTFKKGDLFFSSILVKSKRFDFICFSILRPEEGELKQINFFRLCGLPGDKVEIKNGDLYVNGSLVDNHLTLQHTYAIPITELENVQAVFAPDEEFISPIGNDSLQLYIPDAIVKQHGIKARRMLMEEYTKGYLFDDFPKEWSVDSFGPIRVPTDKYFVLGDNRQNASDSRFVGFIDKSDFRGTVLWKK